MRFGQERKGTVRKKRNIIKKSAIVKMSEIGFGWCFEILRTTVL